MSLLTYPTIGAFVASRRPENLIGWVLCGVGLRFVTEGFALVYVGYALSAQPELLPGEKIAFWVAGWFDLPLVVPGLVLMILLFPDGRLRLSYVEDARHSLPLAAHLASGMGASRNLLDWALFGCTPHTTGIQPCLRVSCSPVLPSARGGGRSCCR